MIGCINKMMRILCCGMLPLAAVVCFILVMIQQCASQGYDDYDDYDECTLSTNPCDRSTSLCYNDGGEYECRCKSGYTGETTTGEEATCNDNNECSSSTTNQCDTSTSDCLNIDGSYQCKCRIGYSGQTTRGFGATCRDINECSMSTHHCTAVTSRCSNTVGSYQCICNRGYIGITTTGRTAACNKDVTAPRVICPSSQFVTISINDQSGIVTWPDPTVTDNSGDSTTFVSVTQRSGSPFPPGETSITYVYEDFNGNEGSCTFNVTVLTDCTALDSNPNCNDVECSCVFEECESLTSVCRGQCETFGCPANMLSESGSQVNPGYPVDMKCSLLGPSSVVTNMQLKLSKSDSTLNEEGIDAHASEYTTGKQERMFTVTEVIQNEQLFCLLLYRSFVIGSVKATRFVHALPRLSSPPSPLTKGYTSLTIMWREWNEQNDAGDPPVVAYIPYYKNATSDQWIAGSSVAANQSPEYTVSEIEQDTNYTFSVAAVREGEGGLGQRGPSVTVKTLCNNSHITPEVTSTAMTGINHINVSWELPVDIECSTGIVSFTVYYEKAGTNEQSTAGSTTENWLVIEGGLLEPDTKYIVYVTVTSDEESGYSRATVKSQITTRTPDNSMSVVYYIVPAAIVFLAAVALTLFIYKRKSQSHSKRKAAASESGRNADYENAGVTHEPDDYIPLDITASSQSQQAAVYQGAKSSSEYEDVDIETTDNSAQGENGDVDYEVPDMFEAYTGIYINTNRMKGTNMPNEMDVKQFKTFMNGKRSEVIAGIIGQFNKLPKGIRHPVGAAQKVQNRSRNVFKSILPYNHSRVFLDKDGSDARSDYINANFVKNSHGSPAFIATQNPTDHTKEDFWRMVWGESIQTIVMISEDSGNTKSTHPNLYWPNKLKTSEEYGDITVLLVASENHGRYIVRRFSLLKGTERVREVKHVEITKWQYGGVPRDVSDVINAINDVTVFQQNGTDNPLLVHCRNGIGATGTFIALYDLMDGVTKTSKSISVFNTVKKMRNDRMDMVQTKLQYLFIFDALFESLNSPTSAMTGEILKKLDHTTTMKKAAEEFQALQHGDNAPQHESTTVGGSPENKHKNRFMNLIPADKFLPALRSPGSNYGSNEYICATNVKRIGSAEFILTQAPQSATVEDFWRLVFDYKCSLVVMMNSASEDETVVRYWPGGKGATAQYGYIDIACRNEVENDVMTKRSFTVTHTKAKKTLEVTHFTYNGPPGNVQKLRMFITNTESSHSGPTLVHCINGVGMSAVYAIVKSEIDGRKQDDMITLFGSAQLLRKRCPHAFQTQEEYLLCYEILQDHLNNPDEYSVVY